MFDYWKLFAKLGINFSIFNSKETKTPTVTWKTQGK